MTDVRESLDGINARLLALTEYADQTKIERAREQERLRTLKPIRSELYIPGQGQLGVPGAVGTTFLLDPGPVEQGYVWDLRIIAGKLSAADSVQAWLGTNAQGMPVGSAASVTTLGTFVILVPKGDGIWNGGEALFLQAATANILQVRCSGWSVAGPEVGKLF